LKIQVGGRGGGEIGEGGKDWSKILSLVGGELSCRSYKAWRNQKKTVGGKSGKFVE